MDRIVIVVALAGFFIRMGNLMNSEIYGIETSLPWGFIFERWGETVPKHPTQIYEGLSYLLIFVLIYKIYLNKKAKLKHGLVFGIFLILLFTFRFFIEFIKEPQVGFEANMVLNMGQILSILPTLIAIVYYVIVYRKIRTQKINNQTNILNKIDLRRMKNLHLVRIII